MPLVVHWCVTLCFRNGKRPVGACFAAECCLVFLFLRQQTRYGEPGGTREPAPSLPR